MKKNPTNPREAYPQHFQFISLSLNSKDTKKTKLTGFLEETHEIECPAFAIPYVKKYYERNKSLPAPFYLDLEASMKRKLFTCSYSMLDVFSRLDAAILTDDPVLILGERGTGKEVIAQAIVDELKKGNPDLVYEARNCGAFPEYLIEDELFGHIKGAFTGATATREGLFENKKDKVVFLDEIGLMNRKCQGGLLRVLQEKKFVKLGTNTSIAIKGKFKLIFATNRDPEKMIKENELLPDFFDRINVMRIILPSLNDRGDDGKNGDIELLAHHFLLEHLKDDLNAINVEFEKDKESRKRQVKKDCANKIKVLEGVKKRDKNEWEGDFTEEDYQNEKRAAELERDCYLNQINKEGIYNFRIRQSCFDLLRNRQYPGNVRELENIIKRAIAFSKAFHNRHVEHRERMNRKLSFMEKFDFIADDFYNSLSRACYDANIVDTEETSPLEKPTDKAYREALATSKTRKEAAEKLNITGPAITSYCKNHNITPPWSRSITPKNSK